MTIFATIILLAAIVAGALAIAYNMQRGTKPMSEFKLDFDNNEQVQEVVDLAKELYNKDLRPAAPKKAPKKEKPVEVIPEGIVEEPVKKDKVTEQVESMKKVVEAHDTLVEEINKISPEVTAVEEVAKPKKKRKYYPRKK